MDLNSRVTLISLRSSVSDIRFKISNRRSDENTDFAEENNQIIIVFDISS